MTAATAPNALSGHLRAFASSLRATAFASSALLLGLADEVQSGGDVGVLLTGHPEAGQPLFGLRALAGLHLLMMEGHAPELAAAVEQASRAGITAPRLWPLARDAILRHRAEIQAALERPVQQHDPQRAAVLQEGLCMLGAPRVRLFELGACAGLGLVPDRYRWSGVAGEWGPVDSPVRLAATPRSRPVDVEIVERAGCDLAPRDPGDPTDARLLRSFVPPEHGAALRRLDAALRLAAEAGVRVDRASAGDWVRERLSVRTDADVCTVVWHSLLWHYLDCAEQERVEASIEEYATRGSVAWIAYEPAAWGRPVRLQVRSYS
ncbi:DUF2332 domain-containing protein [Streptomyces sp. NPDC048629]|uniref:DUF2332 domain-containing protein n=1 Tax=Streptomyces sp. NPDC048629 TaxID=3154824 RepID=UPI0034232C9D